MDEDIKILIGRLQEDGVATAQVKDGRILGISKAKVLELLRAMEDADRDYVILFIKTTN